jgi:hypothetical protein
MGSLRVRDVRLAGFRGHAPLALSVLLSAFVATCNHGLTLEHPDGGNAGRGGASGTANFDDASTDLSTGHNSCVGPRVAQPWPAMVAIDQSDCAARTPIDCGPLGAPSTNAGAALDYQLLTLAQTMCHLPVYTWVMVTFDGGCPSSLSVEDIHGQADANLVSCLGQQLGSVRWVCAQATSCALVEWDTLP